MGTSRKCPVCKPMNSDWKHVIIAADDLGSSSLTTRAIMEAHDRGIVTAASIMPCGDAFQEAVQGVRERSKLSPGLHVTLCDGRSVLPHTSIPDLVDPHGCFMKSPAVTWLNFGKARVMSQVEMEVEAQFNRLETAGIHPSYIDSHHHLHMHPRVFEVICRLASQRGVAWIRIPHEPAPVAFSLRSRSRGAMPFIEWAVFRVLWTCNMRTAEEYGLHCATQVYGLSRTGHIDEQYLLAVLNNIATQTKDHHINEIFTHPDLASAAGLGELQALMSPVVSNRLESLGIRCIGYQEISLNDRVFCAAGEGLSKHAC